MGSNLTPAKDGALFRVGSPGTLEVFISGSFNNWSQPEDNRLA